MNTISSTIPPPIQRRNSSLNNLAIDDNSAIEIDNDRTESKEEEIPITPKNSFHEILEKIHSNKTFLNFSNFTSVFSIIALFTSALFNKSFIKVPDSAAKFFYRLGDISNKTFKVINAVENVTKLIPIRDYTGSLAHFSEMALAFYYKMSDYYLGRGLSLALYGATNALNILNEKARFKTDQEHLQHIASGFTKTYQNFVTDFKKIPRNIFKHEKAMFSTISSGLCFAGYFLWRPLEALFGKNGRVFVAWLRDIGGLFQAFEGMNLGHFFHGKIFFGLAGYSQFLGVVANHLAETTLSKYKDALDPLSFAFTNLNRWFMKFSTQREETGLKN